MNQDISYWVNQIIDGNRALLSQAITLCESSLVEDQNISIKLLEQLIPYSGKSIRIGVTGTPGAGKSTFIEALGTYLISNHNLKIAVLTIDPSSERSKGSILGDKTRMNLLSSMEGAFIRPSPSSSILGGVAKYSYETMLLCEAAGFDIILIETVGVGQSEIAVNQLVDMLLMLQIIGGGDDLQGMKRGLLEWVDLLIINKADQGTELMAENEALNLKNALHLFPLRQSGWIPKVVTCSSLEKRGINEIWSIIETFYSSIKSSGYLDMSRELHQKIWFEQLLRSSIHQFVDQHQSFNAIKNEKLSAYDEYHNPLLLLRELKDELKKKFSSN